MKKILLIISILISYSLVLAEDYEGCQSYFDTVSNKNVFLTVEIFPAYDETGIMSFLDSVNRRFKAEKIVLSHEEAIFNSRVIATFVVSENGEIENIRIARKEEEEYSVMDKLIVNIIGDLSEKKWRPGECNGKKVPTVVYCPMNVNFRH